VLPLPSSSTWASGSLVTEVSRNVVADSEFSGCAPAPSADSSASWGVSAASAISSFVIVGFVVVSVG